MYVPSIKSGSLNTRICTNLYELALLTCIITEITIGTQVEWGGELLTKIEHTLLVITVS